MLSLMFLFWQSDLLHTFVHVRCCIILMFEAQRCQIPQSNEEWAKCLALANHLTVKLNADNIIDINL